jgi:hypothetical protein
MDSTAFNKQQINVLWYRNIIKHISEMSKVDLNVVLLNKGNSIMKILNAVVANISGGYLRYPNKYKYLKQILESKQILW